ncbi:MAG: adenosine deaminase [Candidatus Wallbacteria bacterium GWC2_49_35]|uniref:Adenosine deaminase n=1 Tax=Candidatus Wallbacteria bacterium GWC2_49_35 TaxID=1817813 RepID=A0A1F7WK47_9BACT|nr:MAG: adenosine deaminase [Candidatus Wallbacteria bacterium GWC2_49_35]
MKKEDFPKVELHSHLEGTITAEMLIELSRGGRELQLSSSDPHILQKDLAAYDFQSFNKFMDITRPFRQAPADVKIIAAREFARAAKNGVIYAEYRFNFDRPIWNGIDLDELLDAINAERSAAAREYGLATGLIFGMKRHEDTAEVARMLKIAVREFEKGRIAGIDLNGDERSFPIKMFEKCFSPALDVGCPLTLHAGEWDGPESVRDAIKCGAKRIGHGVRSAEDPRLVELIIKNGVHLEISPTSNVCTGVYKKLSEHPVRKLFDAGVKLSINSDDHGAFGSDIAGEYKAMRDGFGFSDAELARVNEYALDAAFVDAETRERLLNKMRARIL